MLHTRVQFVVLSFDAKSSRFVFVDEYVHRVGQLHDGAHGFAVFTRLVQSVMVALAARSCSSSSSFMAASSICRAAFEQKAGCAAGDIDVLPTKSG